MHSRKLSGYKIGIKFDEPLAVEQNNRATNIVNTYISYESNAWPKVLLENLKLKNCLFGVTNIIKNNDKEKWVNSGYGIAFHRAGLWNFGDDFVNNVAIFVVDNSSSSHIDNH